jgi:hypothetical protein
METWLFCILIVAGSVAASLGGLYIVRKTVKPDGLRKHHELAGSLLGVVGTLNAVLLGLVILEAQSRYQQARTNEAAESSAVADIRLYAEYLPEPTRSSVNDHVCKYVTLVREKEWDSPPTNQPNKEAVKEFHCIWKLICEFKPANSQEQNLQSSMLSNTAQAFDMRRFRITSGRHGLPDILWAVLIVGCVSTVGFTYFFASDSLRIQSTMVAVLSITLSMGILVVCILGNPYVGDWKIRPEQFMRISTSEFPITSDSLESPPLTSGAQTTPGKAAK